MTARKTRPSSKRRGSRGAGGRRSPVHGQAADQQRTVIAQQAARLVLDQGISDYGVAKRKAAERLGGAVSPALLPSNREVEQAVLEHRRLFGGSAADDLLHGLRGAALEAMRFFSAFSPRLVGGVLSGAVSEHMPVTLHLHTDIAEDVPRRLLDAQMSFQTSDARLRYLDDRARRCPCHHFSVDGVDYQVLVLPADAIREAPASPVDGRPERRASVGEVERLLSRPPSAADLPLTD